jgi:uncharacterized protein
MKFTQAAPQGLNLIRRYGPDFVLVGEEELRSSCIVGANELLRDWPLTSLESLSFESFAWIFERKPEVVVLSTGAQQRFPPAALRARFAERRIGLEVMEVGAACRTYNVLVSEQRAAFLSVLMPGR